MKRIKDILKVNELIVKPDDTDLKLNHNIVPGPIPPDVFKCLICQDRGIFLEGDLAYPCTCMKTRKRENQFRHARISRELMNCRFEKFRLDFYSSEIEDQTHLQGAKRAFNASQLFVEECLHNPYGLGIMLTGPVGSGKTFLAAAIANKLIESKFQVLFLIVPDLLDELREIGRAHV